MASSSGKALKRATPGSRTPSPPPIKRTQRSTTTSKAVAQFFTPLSKKEPEKVAWRVVDETLLVGEHQGFTADSGRHKIAGFDLDSTLIKTVSGNRFGRDAADWTWWDASVPGTLEMLSKNGYQVVVLSNQGGLNLKLDPKRAKADQKRISEFKGKVNAVVVGLDIPIRVYAATAKDRFRKPRVGMWEQIVRDAGMQLQDIDLDQSFFVGDAGGRPASAGTRSDHSCCDRDMAANVGIRFHTPEEYFLKQAATPFVRAFEPSEYVRGPDRPTETLTKKHAVDIVLFCGSPGSGKSTFFTRQLKNLGYERVNQDTLKTRERCLKAAEEFLNEQKSVVVDNTNPDPETRGHWVRLAQKTKVPIRCVVFTATAKLCEHNDAVRGLNTGSAMNPENRSILPGVAIAGFFSRYREPTTKEGFEEITKVDFRFEGTAEEQAIWSRYWV